MMMMMMMMMMMIVTCEGYIGALKASETLGCIELQNEYTNEALCISYGTIQ